MNRATFFKTLGLGIVSAPAIAKVLAEPPLFTYHPASAFKLGPRNLTYNPVNYMGNLEWYYWKDGLLYGPDKRPIRFDNLGHDIKRVKLC